MEHLSRRLFLQFFGRSAASVWAAGGLLSCVPRQMEGGRASDISVHEKVDRWLWEGVSYPVSLPTTRGATQVASRYEVRDTLQVPEGFTWDVVISWGDLVGSDSHPASQFRFGYNCDYTALIPKKGSLNEFFLFVNHEYVSARPWTQGYASVYGRDLPNLRVGKKGNGSRLFFLESASSPRNEWHGDDIDLVKEPDGANEKSLQNAARTIGIAALDEMGVSILHVRVAEDGRLEVVKDSREHKRISPYSSVNCRKEAKRAMSGPAREFLPAPRGTACNCSGGVTPWGTVLTCEENFQDITSEYVSPAGESFPVKKFSAEGKSDVLGLPVAWGGVGSAVTPPLDGRGYGWVCEVDPESGSFVKHSSLGRFRHENVTLKVIPGQPLRAYMGDDRRGGHVWRYESSYRVQDPLDARTSSLLTDGVLSVAKFNTDFSGEWIPLLPSTPLRRPEPEQCSSGHMMLPRRPAGGAVGVGTAQSEFAEVSVAEYIKSVEKFCGKPFDSITLGDLVVVSPGNNNPASFIQHVLLLDAFLFGNLIGGTPTARPEDVEVDTHSDGIFIAFTEAFSRHEGSPDSRIFHEKGAQSGGEYGAIFFLEENREEKESAHFTWSKLVRSGEVGDGGSGFACADNLAIDSHGDLWVVCDITTDALNREVSRVGDTAPGSKGFLGMFGNSSIFRIPRLENGLGFPECFAIGPCESELTGPTFLPHQGGLLLSVQHPGEHAGTRSSVHPHEDREYRVLMPHGEIVTQHRRVPIGSNFPNAQLNSPPKPSVVCIRPRQ